METITKEKQASRWTFYRRRLRFEIFRRDNFTCQYCGRNVADGIQLTLEHVEPKSKGGDYSEENLITACHECNQGKWDTILSKWELQDLKRVWGSLRPQPSIIIIARF